MRVLIVHNFYGSANPSGENFAVLAESKLLKEQGHEVVEFFVSSDDLSKNPVIASLHGGLSTPWNPFSAQRLKRLINATDPDLIHVHNTFPVISPSIFSGINRSKPIILTLHNYRLVCPAAIPMRSGKVCTLCIDKKSVIPSLKHGCYRNSRIATTPLAMNVSLHRKLDTWNKHISSFIVATSFQKNTIADAGIDKQRVHVKPYFLDNSSKPLNWNDRQEQIVYAGRLTEEKGVDLLIKAWELWGEKAPHLVIIGSGELETTLQAEVVKKNLNIRFLGNCSHEETQMEIGKSKLIIVPSRWYEVFGIVLIEAFSTATPALVSSLGSLPAIVENGKYGSVFQNEDANSLLKETQEMWKNQTLLEQIGIKCRGNYLQNYTPEANYSKLVKIYTNAVSAHHSQIPHN